MLEYTKRNQKLKKLSFEIKRLFALRLQLCDRVFSFYEAHFFFKHAEKITERSRLYAYHVRYFIRFCPALGYQLHYVKVRRRIWKLRSYEHIRLVVKRTS